MTTDHPAGPAAPARRTASADLAARTDLPLPPWSAHRRPHGPAPRRLRDTMTTVGTSSSVANIIMQLSLPAVGEGVSESRVVSGSPRRRPVKRGRTTMTYLALATMGTEDDRTAMRREIARVHAQVRSTPDSPVAYNANAADLQLWVAACLFRYFLDQYRLLYGEMPRDALDDLTRSAAPLATGLNVRPDAWPSSWQAFEDYWDSMIPRLGISDQVRQDFEDLAHQRILAEAWGPIGRLVASTLGPSYAFLTRAHLPPYFRELMGWTWTEADQRRFERVLRLQALADRLGNRAVIRLGYRLHVVDFRLRRRVGLPVLGRLRISETMIRDGGGQRRRAWRR